MLKVGITGGIGSGKTVICNIFKCLGVPVYNADTEAKILSDIDPEIRDNLTKLFGEDIYKESGLDRKKLASIIFNDPYALNKVNRVIHPKVRDHFFKWCKEHENYDYIIQEAAILFESGAYKFFDKYITVSAPVELRISRTIQRENTTHQKIQKIISNQISEEDKIKRSHYVIVNDDKNLVIPQVIKIHNEIIKRKIIL